LSAIPPARAIRIRPVQTAVPAESAARKARAPSPGPAWRRGAGENAANREPQQRVLNEEPESSEAGPQAAWTKISSVILSRRPRKTAVSSRSMDGVPVPGRHVPKARTIAAPHPLHQPLVRFLFPQSMRITTAFRDLH